MDELSVDGGPRLFIRSERTLLVHVTIFPFNLSSMTLFGRIIFSSLLLLYLALLVTGVTRPTLLPATLLLREDGRILLLPILLLLPTPADDDLLPPTPVDDFVKIFGFPTPPLDCNIIFDCRLAFKDACSLVCFPTTLANFPRS